MGSVWNKFFKKELIEGHRFDEELSYLEDGYFKTIAKIGLNSNKAMAILNTSSFEWLVRDSSDGSQQILKSGEHMEIFDKMIIRFSNYKEVKIRLM